MPEPERPVRPYLVADVERLSAAAATGEPLAKLELAHATAAAVIQAGRNEADVRPEQFVALADMVGLDTLAALWREAADDTLPGALWALYALRGWCRARCDLLDRWYQAGRSLSPVDDVVAGVADHADRQSALESFSDAVLMSAYCSDFAIALERAASFFRIVALGRCELAGDANESAEYASAERNVRCADALQRAAELWRKGSLR